MFRTAERHQTTRRLRDWIKMLFLWAREPATPRAGPWFAWFATAVLLWRYRRRIAKAIFGPISSLRLLRRKRTNVLNAPSIVVSKALHHHHLQQQRRSLRTPLSAPVSAGDQRRACRQSIKYQNHGNSAQHVKPQALRRETGSMAKSRLKRLQTGDGPHVTSASRKLTVSSSCVQISQQLYCRVTRSGRVYGKYSNKALPLK